MRINSPPFYRLNYRGIVVEAHLSGENSFVKPHFQLLCLIALSLNNLLHFQTILTGNNFAGLSILPHHLKCGFTFFFKVCFEYHFCCTPCRNPHDLVRQT
ncbi:DUF5951 family protein [Escherichia fergusonii]|uniref:DUF5951 family protein n=1 Tax=Escherichia fergusonii TaxID=564 RepID=UPI00359FC02B